MKRLYLIKIPESFSSQGMKAFEKFIEELRLSKRKSIEELLEFAQQRSAKVETFDFNTAKELWNFAPINSNAYGEDEPLVAHRNWNILYDELRKTGSAAYLACNDTQIVTVTGSGRLKTIKAKREAFIAYLKARNEIDSRGKKAFGTKTPCEVCQELDYYGILR